MVIGRVRDAWLGSLAKRAQRGDREAFRRLFRSLHPAVFGFVARRVRRKEDAEDLTSRVFEKLLSALATYDPARASIRTFVLAMARNAVIDHARAKTLASLPIEEAEIVPDFAPGPFDALVGRERLEAVRAEVQILAPDVQELLALRFGDELSHGEIAALLEESEAAVRQRLSRVVRELRSRVLSGSKREVFDVAS